MSNKEKIDYLIRKHYSRMHAEAMRILNDYHLAEDACQDTAVKLIRSADSLRDIDSEEIRNYCLVLVRNQARDVARKWNKQIPSVIVYEDDKMPRVFDEYPVETEEMLEDIMELPEYYRIAVLMRCFAQKTCLETAKITGCSVGTVNCRINRARKMLQKKWNTAC